MVNDSRNIGSCRGERIAVTGIGFVSPVGDNVWKAALAMRKKRSAFFAHETVLVAEDRYGSILRGATVSRMPDETLSRHLTGADRAVALLAPAIREALAGVPLHLLEKALWQVDQFLGAEEDFRQMLSEALPDIDLHTMESCNEKLPDFPRCLFFERIIRGIEWLRARDDRQVVLVGVSDSLVTEPRLEELLLAGRLKDAVNPEGIMTGEAAGAILLEKESHARSRSATVYAYVASCGRGNDAIVLAGRPSTGGGLTEAFHQAFDGLEGAGARVGTVVTDLNGERWRALDWAYTEARIFPGSDRKQSLKHPADTLGDCGGAMGAVLVVDAITGFMLHSRPPLHIALSTSDEGGARRVLCLEWSGGGVGSDFMDGVRRKLGEGFQHPLPEEDSHVDDEDS